MVLQIAEHVLGLCSNVVGVIVVDLVAETTIVELVHVTSSGGGNC